MTKTRIPIPANVTTEVMFASDSACCICNERGKAVQIHHIDDNPANNALSNLAVLCLQCHDKTQISGGFGRKLNGPLVTKYRDEWLARVIQRREDADRIAVMQTAHPAREEKVKPVPVAYSEERTDAILEYVNALPKLRLDLRKRAQKGWDTGVTATMVDTTYEYIDGLQGILVRMASFYSPGTFGESPQRFFSDLVASSFRWHWAHAEPDGPGMGGTIVNITCGNCVVEDVEKMVKDMAESLVGYDDRFDWRGWPGRWGEVT